MLINLGVKFYSIMIYLVKVNFMFCKNVLLRYGFGEKKIFVGYDWFVFFIY